MYMYIFIFIYLILLSDDLGIMWFSISSFRSPGKVCTISLKIRGRCGHEPSAFPIYDCSGQGV